ncbi:hypothetical protein BJY52DRAFT_1227416 [Lactarius psammicola]|nr:hypothetical protein BJY52DRAFT_1227416 [Lactarius psammicola]
MLMACGICRRNETVISEVISVVPNANTIAAAHEEDADAEDGIVAQVVAQKWSNALYCVVADRVDAVEKKPNTDYQDDPAWPPSPYAASGMKEGNGNVVKRGCLSQTKRNAAHRAFLVATTSHRSSVSKTALTHRVSGISRDPPRLSPSRVRGRAGSVYRARQPVPHAHARRALQALLEPKRKRFHLLVLRLGADGTRKVGSGS